MYVCMYVLHNLCVTNFFLSYSVNVLDLPFASPITIYIAKYVYKSMSMPTQCCVGSLC